MKTKNILVLVALFLITKSLTAQISIPSDSIRTTLCKKWGFTAIIMNGQRLPNTSESLTYEFIADGTFKRISTDGKTLNGTWEYKPDQKFILLKIKKTALHIPSLSNSELIVFPGNTMNEAKNGLGVGTVLTPLGNN